MIKSGQNSFTVDFSSVVLRYGAAAVLVTSALCLHLVLTSWIGQGLPPYIFFHPAVVVAALLAGLGPGIFATVLAILAAGLWLLHPLGDPLVASAGEQLSLLLFTMNSLLLCGIAHLYRRSRMKTIELERKAAVSERNNAEAALRTSEERFRILASHAPVGIYLTDADGGCLFVNERWQDFAGLSMEQAKGSGWSQALHPEDRGRVFDEWKRFAQSEADFTSDYRFMRPDGKVTWLHGSAVALRDSQQRVTGYLGSVADITERKQAEEAIRRYSEELKRSNEYLEQFATITSHDLKEPLRIISVYAQLMAKRYEKKLDEKADEFLSNITKNTNRMAGLIESLLVYSKVGKGAEEFRDIELQAVYEQALRNLEVSIQESGATLRCEALPCVRADETQMLQVFQNLIANAVKFRSSEPLIISIRCQAEGDDYVLSVKDNGIGISEEHFHRIFDIFRKLHAQSEYPGTGVGLAICKRVVENHGGRIWLNSRQGKGTTFYFTLPRVSVMQGKA